MKHLLKLLVLAVVASLFVSCHTHGARYTIYGDAYHKDKYERAGYPKQATSSFTLKNYSSEVFIFTVDNQEVQVPYARKPILGIFKRPGKVKIRHILPGLTNIGLSLQTDSSLVKIDSVKMDVLPCHNFKQKIRRVK